jgi:polysaccharide export outer membrane protein
MTRRALFIAAGLSMLTACASPAANLPPIPNMSQTAYLLGAGDEVRISVFGLDALNNTYVVGDAGTISLPLVNEIPAKGKTTQELEALIASSLRDKDVVKNPSVSAQVLKYRPFFILGEVQRPGQYPYVPGMSVLTAVSIAGGYTFRANAKAASITRNEGEKVLKGSATPQTPVMPGDTILVPEDWF